MVQLKVLIVLTAAIIIQILDADTLKKAHETCVDSEITFYGKSDTVVLKKKEYRITVNAIGFELMILNKTKLVNIYKLEDPNVKFCLNEKIVVAKGIFVLSSSVPEAVDYFFTFSKDKRILKLINQTMLFRKVPPG